MFISNFIFLILYLYNAHSLDETNIVKTTTGPIKGKLNYYGRIKYISYEGIPYALPPIGKLRFMPTVPVRPWIKVLDATAPGYVCPQIEYFHLRHEMSEDCLFLNIYVPVTNSSKLLPVVYYIHGASFLISSGGPTPVNGPQLMLQKDMIVVSINYRLGALGFLSLGLIDASGNAGLKDIYVALKWVNNNIENFGGDPNSICLLGQGSGATLVHFLLLTNQTTGLFQSAAMFGGSALSYKSLQLHPNKNALKLAQKLGIKYLNKKDLLKKLKEADPMQIVDAQESIMNNDPRKAFIVKYLFSPTIEKPSSIAIITKNPLDIIRKVGLLQKVPIITGCNNNEGLEGFSVIQDDPEAIQNLNLNFEYCVPPNIQYPYGSEERKNLANAIRQFYFNGGNITIYKTQNYINLLTDTTDSYSIYYWINLYKTKAISSAVYYYSFNFDGNLNWPKLVGGITYPGARHSDEMGYLFIRNLTENRLQNIDSKDQMVIDGLLHSLKNLAMYGNPSATKFGFPWVEAGAYGPHLVIDDKITNVRGPPTPHRLSFWRKVYDEYERRIGS